MKIKPRLSMKLLREYMYEWSKSPAPLQQLGYQDTVKHFLYFVEEQMKSK